MYDSNRSDINNREMNVQFNCFPITGEKVDHAGHTLLREITAVEVSYDSNDPTKVVSYAERTNEAEGVDRGANTTNPIRHVASLDSADYTYGIMDANRNKSANIRNPILTNAIEGKASKGNSGDYSREEKALWTDSESWNG
jgi:hypothetical protein